MKALASSEPHRATELLQQAPQLAAAVFQALLLMGLVSPEAVSSVIEQGAPPPVQPPVGYPAPPMPGYPAAPVTNNTPPVSGVPYPPPQSYGAPPAAASVAAPAAAPDQEALMRAVMELPESQINMLAEADRQQILALRAQFAGQRR